MTRGTGYQGGKGDKGDIGAQGSKGDDGDFGGATFRYLTDTVSRTSSDPGEGKIKFNEKY